MGNNISSCNELLSVLLDYVKQMPDSESKNKRDILFALAKTEEYGSAKRLYISSDGVFMVCATGNYWSQDTPVARFKCDGGKWLTDLICPIS